MLTNLSHSIHVDRCLTHLFLGRASKPRSWQVADPGFAGGGDHGEPKWDSGRGTGALRGRAPGGGSGGEAFFFIQKSDQKLKI